MRTFRLHCADLITSVRIACAVLLLVSAPLSVGYVVLYLLCVASDAVDGPVARALGTAGEGGALLDSVADTIFALALLVTLLPAIPWPTWVVVWVGAILVIKLATLGVGWRRFGRLAYLHTWANKAAGLVCALFPLLYLALGVGFAAGLACVVASVAATEELVLTVRSPELDLDRRGIWWDGGRR